MSSSAPTASSSPWQLADGRELLSTIKGVLKRQRRGTDLVAVGDRVFVTRRRRRRGTHRIGRTENAHAFPARPSHQRRRADHPGEPGSSALSLCRARSRATSAPARPVSGDGGVPQSSGTHWRQQDGSRRHRQRTANRRSRGACLAAMRRSTRSITSVRKRVRASTSCVRRWTEKSRPSLDHPVLENRACSTCSTRRETVLVGAISAATGKGRHTTTATVLHRIPGETQTFVADTPGIRALSLQGVGARRARPIFPGDAAVSGAMPICRLLAPVRTRVRSPGSG